MATVRQAMEALERLAPRRYAFPFDKVGLQVGDPTAPLTKGVVSLDRSLSAVHFAADEGAQMLIAHHPLIFEPVATVLQTSHVGRTILELARKNIAFAAVHTNWDSARGGINDALAGLVGLTSVSDFGTAAQVSRLKLVLFCPPEAAEAVIDAASEAGAGLIGEYARCAFTQEGLGTFLGGENSNPAVGSKGQIEKVEETRVEMVLMEDRMRAVARAIRRVHPYEAPAFDFFRLASESEQPAGRIGVLPEPTTLRELLPYLDQRLETVSCAWGRPDRSIKKLAVVGGAADSEWREARQAGADALLTGEVKQHVGLEVVEEGFAIIASGHFATEHPGCRVLRDRLAEAMPDVEWLLYTPEPGLAGRPDWGKIGGLED
ncbi:MAG TPA: Nif3-like dinuclear metal center hexameric protein [Fimbriimonadaceae bacterium]|nr:Nif3-like dinuclear metal center hexameric protein [Fimbriimonadaceae bacterium]